MILVAFVRTEHDRALPDPAILPHDTDRSQVLAQSRLAWKSQEVQSLLARIGIPPIPALASEQCRLTAWRTRRLTSPPFDADQRREHRRRIRVAPTRLKLRAICAVDDILFSTTNTRGTLVVDTVGC